LIGRMMRMWTRLRRDLAGATAIEYAMVAVLISIAAFAALQIVGSSVTGMFSSVASGF
jgi:pilus assembly protein Flp/PilA